LALPVLSLTLVGSSCKRKDPAACDNAQQVSKQAAASGDFDLARQWREHAYKKCGADTNLSSLDQEIVRLETEAKQKKADEDAQAQETEQLLKLFTGWVGQHKADPNTAAVNVTCQGEENEDKARWCTRERSVGGKYQVKVVYWEGEPEAHQFSTVAPGDVTCEALGGTQASEKLSGAWRHCQLGGALGGMQALIRRYADGVHIDVVSQKFIDKHAGFRAQLMK
jgi:hypothetical protein